MKTSLRVLIVEDSEFDAQMMVSMLRKGGYEVSAERVETEAALRAALAGKTALKDVAVDQLAKFICEIGPSPLDRPPATAEAAGDLHEVACDPDGQPLAYVWKTIVDRHDVGAVDRGRDDLGLLEVGRDEHEGP